MAKVNKVYLLRAIAEQMVSVKDHYKQEPYICKTKIEICQQNRNF
jgi:hypothetical protein